MNFQYRLASKRRMQTLCFVAMTVATSLLAYPVLALSELNCELNDVDTSFSLFVDIENGFVFLGDKDLQHAYEIQSATSNFITALGLDRLTTNLQVRPHNFSSKHGGSVIVINRKSGAFYYTNIGLNCDQSDCQNSPVNLRAQSGKCSKALF